MAKLRLRAYNATALYVHLTPELLKVLKTKLIMLQLPHVEVKLTTFRNQHKKTTRKFKVARNTWLEGRIAYPDLTQAGPKMEAYWIFTLANELPF